MSIASRFIRASVLGASLGAAACAAPQQQVRFSDSAILNMPPVPYSDMREKDCPAGWGVSAHVSASGGMNQISGLCTVQIAPPREGQVHNRRYLNMAWGDAVCLPGARAHAVFGIQDGVPTVKTSCREETIPEMVDGFKQLFMNSIEGIPFGPSKPPVPQNRIPAPNGSILEI
jgi:hypothetical protein